MNWIWWIMAIIVVLLLAVMVLLSDIRMQFHYSRSGEKDHFNVSVRALYGLVRFQYVIPLLKFQGLKGFLIEHNKKLNEQLTASENKKEWIDKRKITQYFEEAKMLLSHTEGLTTWSKQTLQHINCTEFRWTTRVGLKDAPETAILTGAIWGIKTSIVHLAAKYTNLRTQPKLHVFPIYNHPHFSMEILVIAHIKVGHALVMGLKLMKRVWKVKDGLRTWKRVLTHSSKRNPEPS